MTLATAESCTGGLVGHLVTQIPGSSSFYRGGVVAYADEVKQALLDVPGALLGAHGAVSGDVASAMASGARERLQADAAIGVTGIAGPDGGTAEKPVGLVFIAASAASRESVVERHLWPYDRDGNKRAAAGAALDLLHAVLSRPTRPR